MDLVNSASRCCFVLPLMKVNFRVYLSSNLNIRTKRTNQTPTDWKTEELSGPGTTVIKYQTAEEGTKGEGREPAEKREEDQ